MGKVGEFKHGQRGRKIKETWKLTFLTLSKHKRRCLDVKCLWKMKAVEQWFKSPKGTHSLTFSSLREIGVNYYD